MGGPREHYAEYRYMSDRKGQILYKFTYMWNLTKHKNEQNETKHKQIQIKRTN